LSQNELIRCPSCHSTEVIPIVYGCSEPLPDPDLDDKRIFLKEACQGFDDPEWHCKACGHQWWGKGIAPDKTKERQ